jgi:hypothetical protein
LAYLHIAKARTPKSALLAPSFTRHLLTNILLILSHVVKRGLIKQRIFAATWSMIVFLAIQSYLTSTMSMATNVWLMLGVGVAYLGWIGLALRQLKTLDAEYATKLAQVE